MENLFNITQVGSIVLALAIFFLGLYLLFGKMQIPTETTNAGNASTNSSTATS